MSKSELDGRFQISIWSHDQHSKACASKTFSQPHHDSDCADSAASRLFGSNARSSGSYGTMPELIAAEEFCNGNNKMILGLVTTSNPSTTTESAISTIARSLLQWKPPSYHAAMPPEEEEDDSQTSVQLGTRSAEIHSNMHQRCGSVDLYSDHPKALDSEVLQLKKQTADSCKRQGLSFQSMDVGKFKQRTGFDLSSICGTVAKTGVINNTNLGQLLEEELKVKGYSVVPSGHTSVSDSY